MTDLEKFVELYRSFGIECKVNKIITLVEDDRVNHNCSVIKLNASGYSDEESTLSDKIIGYDGFYSEVVFDKEGKFIYQGIWE